MPAMSFARVMGRAAVVALLIVSCQGANSTPPDGTPPDGALPDGAPTGCDPGAKECHADGLYSCDANRAFQLTAACASCEATPVPHCAVSCADAGITSICEGDSVKDCATGMTVSCEVGTCLPFGQQAVCATKPGTSTCQGRQADGAPYLLACADANGVSTTEVCDQRTGQCVAAQFDCPALTSVPAGNVACDHASGNYYSACVAGQPTAVTCSSDTTCADDGTTNCYTGSTPGGACGGSTVCYPGLHCVQQAADAASCVRPAGQLACNSTDVLAVCNDVDTGVACVDGTVWWWKNLTAWGGSCTSNRITLAAGGVCLPGLADCKQGLECHRSPYDITGICRTPEADAPAECTLTAQISTGRSCSYDWHACRDGHYYDIDCRPVNLGGNVLTLCDCSVDGAKTNTFSGSAICNVTSTGMLDASAMAGCLWDVTTVDVTEN